MEVQEYGEGEAGMRDGGPGEHAEQAHVVGQALGAGAAEGAGRPQAQVGEQQEGDGLAAGLGLGLARVRRPPVPRAHDDVRLREGPQRRQRLHAQDDPGVVVHRQRLLRAPQQHVAADDDEQRVYVGGCLGGHEQEQVQGKRVRGHCHKQFQLYTSTAGFYFLTGYEQREEQFCVCTISLLSPPNSVFSQAQVRHL